jgi:hypothetical protein
LAWEEDRVRDHYLYLIIWEFHVRPEVRLAFVKIYGPNGAWAQLFRRSADFRGTELVCDLNRPSRYLTLDQWSSREAFLRFKQDHHTDYTVLDKQCENLTEHEALVGEFESPADDLAIHNRGIS